MSSCDIAEVSGCFDPLSGYQLTGDGLLFHDISDDDLDGMCSQFLTVQECVDDSVGLCSAIQKAKIFSRIDVLKFLCTSGYEGYKNTRSCLNNEDLLDAAKDCNTTFTAGMSEFHNLQGKTYTQKKQHICKCMTSLITCVGDSASEICGKESGEWIYNIKTRMMSGSLSEIGCMAERDLLPTILAISFAIFIAVVVIGLAFIVIYKKVKAEDEKQKKQTLTLSMNRTSDRPNTTDRHNNKRNVNTHNSAMSTSHKNIPTAQSLLLSSSCQNHNEDFNSDSPEKWRVDTVEPEVQPEHPGDNANELLISENKDSVVGYSPNGKNLHSDNASVVVITDGVHESSAHTECSVENKNLNADNVK